MSLSEQGRKGILLAILLLHTSGCSILMHYSRKYKGPHGTYYSTTSSVLLGEIVKIAISFLGAIVFESNHIKEERLAVVQLVYEQKEPLLSSHPANEEENGITFESSRSKGCYGPSFEDLLQASSRVRSKAFSAGWMTMMVPSVLYVLQNNLQLISTSSVGPLIYQAVSQIKVLMTSIISVYFLHKHLSTLQWSAVLALTFGIGVVVVAGAGEGSPMRKREYEDIGQERFLFGAILIVLATFVGSLAAVFTEYKIKSDKNINLWIRNLQLAMFSILPSLAAVLISAANVGLRAQFDNLDRVAWSVVLMRSAGGFAVALVLRYCDAILKGTLYKASCMKKKGLISILPSHIRICNKLSIDCDLVD